MKGRRFILIDAADIVVRRLPSKADGPKIIMEIFELGAPVLCKHPFHAAACGPSGNEIGEVVTRPTSTKAGAVGLSQRRRCLDLAVCQSAGAVDEDCRGWKHAKASTKRAEPPRIHGSSAELSVLEVDVIEPLTACPAIP